MDKLRSVGNQVLKVLGVLFVIVVILAILSPSEKKGKEEAVVKGDVPVEEVKAVTNTKQSLSNTETLFKDGFINGCMDGDSTKRDFCECSYTFLYNKYGVDRMISLGLRASDSNMNSDDQVMLEGALKACISKY